MNTWHQNNVAKRNHRNRHKKAHIHAPDYVATGKTLCGLIDPPVYVDKKDAHNPANNVCKKCAAKIKPSIRYDLWALKVWDSSIGDYCVVAIAHNRETILCERRYQKATSDPARPYLDKIVHPSDDTVIAFLAYGNAIKG